MVRSVADRAFLPAKSLFEQVGDMMILTGRTLVSAVKPPYPYGEEFIGQFLFALQLCWFPLLVSTVAFGFGAPGLQAANFLSLFGALDRLGGFFVLASIRAFPPFVTAGVVAGVAGTAITATRVIFQLRRNTSSTSPAITPSIMRLLPACNVGAHSSIARGWRQPVPCRRAACCSFPHRARA